MLVFGNRSPEGWGVPGTGSEGGIAEAGGVREGVAMARAGLSRRCRGPLMAAPLASGAGCQSSRGDKE